MPDSNDISQLVSRFDRLDNKFDDLRKELMASFVLKQVFDTVLAARDKEFDELKKDFDAHKQAEMGKFQRNLLILGGILGLISAFLNLLQHFHL